jgi:hypothetical protein
MKKKMKNKLITVVVILFCLCVIPTSTLADTRSYTPPPRKGVIFVVVRFKGYSSTDIRRSTKVSVKWGGYNRSGRFSGTKGGRALLGVVIRLRHDNNDSVPLTIDTEGQILQLEQTTRSPSQWTDPSWETTDW